MRVASAHTCPLSPLRMFRMPARARACAVRCTHARTQTHAHSAVRCVCASCALCPPSVRGIPRKVWPALCAEVAGAQVQGAVCVVLCVPCARVGRCVWAVVCVAKTRYTRKRNCLSLVFVAALCAEVELLEAPPSRLAVGFLGKFGQQATGFLGKAASGGRAG